MKTNSRIPGSTKLNSRIESNRGLTVSFNETSNINKNIKIPRSKQTSTQTSEVSLTSKFDELVRNREILTSGQTEKKFLTFSINAEKNRQKWGNAEVECQILVIELEKSLEEISSMKCKLKQAREMLQTESELRKKAENDRDRLANKLALYQHLSELDQHLVSHALLQERMSMMTQTFSPESVQSVSELTFDDKDSPSHGVCKDGNRKRNRSRGQSLDWDEELEEQLVEMVTEKLNVRNVHKMKIEKKEMLQQEQQNRGLSFGTILKNPKKYTIDREQVENDFQSRRSSISSDTPSCHKFVQKTVLKSEKCLGCDKRMRFGKMELRCGVCRLSIHEECCVLAPQYCGVSHESRSQEPIVRKTRVQRSNTRKYMFASPMLRQSFK